MEQRWKWEASFICGEKASFLVLFQRLHLLELITGSTRKKDAFILLQETTLHSQETLLYLARMNILELCSM